MKVRNASRHAISQDADKPPQGGEQHVADDEGASEKGGINSASKRECRRVNFHFLFDF
jgi:hypothetical protein